MASKILPVVWHNQRNNELFPFGTCNATSIACLMQYKNILGGWNGQGQLDDFVTRQLDTPAAWEVHRKTLPDWRSFNPRNNPFVLQWYLGTIGVKDNFYQVSQEKDKSALYKDGQKIMNGNIEIIKSIHDSIDRDMPVIMAGNYTRKRTNGTQDVITHINLAVGYDDNNIIVNDPFGNALNYYLPYENDGDHVAYPNGFIQSHVTQLHILTIG